MQKPPVMSPGLFIGGSWLIVHLDFGIIEILILHDDGSHQGSLKFFSTQPRLIAWNFGVKSKTSTFIDEPFTCHVFGILI